MLVKAPLNYPSTQPPCTETLTVTNLPKFQTTAALLMQQRTAQQSTQNFRVPHQAFWLPPELDEYSITRTKAWSCSTCCFPDNRYASTAVPVESLPIKVLGKLCSISPTYVLQDTFNQISLQEPASKFSLSEKPQKWSFEIQTKIELQSL